MIFCLSEHYFLSFNFFIKFLYKIQPITAAISSATGKVAQTPYSPVVFDKTAERGMMITNWRNRDTINDWRPFPRASNTPERTHPTVEIKNPAAMMRSMGTPISSISPLALKSFIIHWGNAIKSKVPRVMITPAASRLAFKVSFIRFLFPAP